MQLQWNIVRPPSTIPMKWGRQPGVSLAFKSSECTYMQASNCFITILLFCIVHEGTAFVSQKLHTVDGPDPAGGDAWRSTQGSDCRRSSRRETKGTNALTCGTRWLSQTRWLGEPSSQPKRETAPWWTESKSIRKRETTECSSSHFVGKKHLYESREWFSALKTYRLIR